MNFFSKIVNKNSNNNGSQNFHIGGDTFNIGDIGNNVVINDSFNGQNITVNGNWNGNGNNIINGSGKVISLEHTLSNSIFSEIESNVSINVFITGGNEESIIIKGDDNIIEHVEIENHNGILNIGFENNLSFSTNNEITINITTKNIINNIDLSGSGEIYLLDIYDKDLNIELLGSGEIDIKGDNNIDNLQIRVSGSGSVSIGDSVEVENINAKVSGSGDIYSNNCINAKLKVSGSGDITIGRYTNIISEKISGSGDINRK